MSRLTDSEVTVCGGDKADKQMIRKTAQTHKLVSLGNGATDYCPGNLCFFKIANSGYPYWLSSFLSLNLLLRSLGVSGRSGTT